MPGKMHADEVDTDPSLVRRLLADQFPQWAGLPIERFESSGTDNAIYRLGKDMAVRLPRIPGGTGTIDKELRWLPKLAPLLPFAISQPLAKGSPGHRYPWHWSVHQWLDGESVNVERMADSVGLAQDLGGFVAALRRIDAAEGPIAGRDGSRGVPLARRDAATREAIVQLNGVVDTRAVTAAWEASVRAPTWQRPGVWIHGDLLSGNVLVDGRGRLRAVIDFGCMVVGDPACDVMAAWTLFEAEGREAFRSAIGVDDATWARGRGWALSFALIALPYYMHTNPVFVRDARHVIREVLADQA
ncbi:MAG TPA: aminoglycoside phosphotransferase family protein [Gaiellales bacterium]|nr:aminoglycoside phosphotransferase family protein [Gaiellales bacterium]